jgi:L-alanine-DL-glutamate epimerase-like enolase superfamily enzyme
MASVLWEVEPLRVELRTPFGTAHSSTTTRTNALVRCVLEVHDDADAGRPRRAVVGIAEVGLPPKKPGVYDAEYADVERLVSEGLGPSGGIPDLSNLPEWCLPDARRAIREGPRASACERALLAALASIDASAHAPEPSLPAARAGLEVALLDAWAKLRGVSLRALLGFPSSPSPSPSPSPPRGDVVPSYYTVAAAPDDDLDALLANARWGRRRTPFIKLKVRANLEETAAALDAVLRLAHENEAEVDVAAGTGDADTTPTGSTTSQTPLRSSPRRRWIALDANASWTAATTEAALAALSAYLPSVAVLEQPYPADVTRARGASAAAWARAVRGWRRAGVLVTADESAADGEDVTALAGMGLADAINVKMEKAGGPRGMVRAAEAAKRVGARTWLGIMVCTRLGCSATAELRDLVTMGGGDDRPGDGDGDDGNPRALAFCDLDGSLLCAEASQARFAGGVEWRDGEGVVPCDGPGHGVTERR